MTFFLYKLSVLQQACVSLVSLMVLVSVDYLTLAFVGFLFTEICLPFPCQVRCVVMRRPPVTV